MRGFTERGAALPGVSFWAYSGITYGARPTSLDIDGDGRDELVVAPGPGAGYRANIRTFRVGGGPVSPVGAGFLAFSGPTQGARAAGGQGLLVVSAGPSPQVGTDLRGFAFQSGYQALPGYDLEVYPGHVRGAVPTLVQLDGSGFWEAVCAPGPDPSYPSHLKAVSYDGASARLRARPNFVAFGLEYRYGAGIGASVLGP